MATIINTQATGIHAIAPATKIALTPSTAGTFHVPQITPESAKTASDLLTQNHDKYHIFFNQSGFHNHIAHHLLTIFALGATPSELQHGYASNQSYQRPQHAVATDVLQQMSSSRDKLASFYGNERYFRDFEDFFAREIEAKGVKATLDEWMFRGDDVAEGMLTRMFAGFYHPIIHFGFALEFHQPAILTESLAQAAIHDNWVAPYLISCEKAAKTQQPKPQKSLITLLHEARSNATIRSSPHASDGNKMRDGVLARAATPMIDIASQWTVNPTQEDLKFKTAEMVQTAFYFAAGAQNPSKIPKFDFFYMHATNASIFFSAFIEDPATQAQVFGDNDTGRKNLARLLEMKARSDLAMYISRNSPDLDVTRIRDYAPKHADQGWDGIFRRACAYDDDGHASKLVRATANAERVCREFEHQHDWPLRGDMWLKIGHMVMDSVEAGGPRWVRDTGRSEAWSEVPDRDETARL